MKKSFFAVVTALSLAGFGFAQDEYEEEVVYEEVAEEAPAAAEEEEVVYEEVEEEEAAPAPKKAPKPKKPSVPNANGKIGIGAELTGLDAIRIVYNLDASLGIVGLLGMEYYSIEAEASQAGMTVTTDDGGFGIMLGLGVIYTMPTSFLPMFFEGDITFATEPTDEIAHAFSGASAFGLDFYLGAKATVVKSFEIAGQISLGFSYSWWEAGGLEYSVLDLGLKTKVYATWYFM